MVGWPHLLVTGGSVAVVTTLLIVLIWRLFFFKKHKTLEVTTTRPATNNNQIQSIQDGVAKVHQESRIPSPNLHRPDSDAKFKRGNNFNVFRRGVSSKPLFNWADHPAMITDAVENGWSRFGFTGHYVSSPSARSSLLGFCAAGDYNREAEAEISWEVCQGSADFMQKIRLNPGGFKRKNPSNLSMSAASVIRTALPLPGPPLGNLSFPQEAYFEITILFSPREENDSVGSNSKESERSKLIQINQNPKTNSDSLVHVSSSSHRISNIEEMRFAVKDDYGKEEAVVLSIGLTAGGSLPLKLPGTYPGSIGFNSTGSVFLDGMKLVFESVRTEWGRTGKVIGCGYDPKQKKVFFTVDSELVHVIHCKSDEFGSPLYPTLAANADILVLVNLGQSTFNYAPANAQRTPNPCFIGPLVKSPALGYEDSKELFSMGRIDSQWLNRSVARGSLNNHNGVNKEVDFDEESEADLFEIVLESSGRSPNTTS
ncbi:hypothetical protein HS088_TW11G00736 [Tripterygium wilfordii]|uniref:B30.2/SPRY domain-containing protein n=1 Tax=Tripterygium wilfordii TaxID=458696 RepID=A0A7J7D330_TRIWF|nr:uncharacterized protein LOC120008871 [Tripterygium wilfordii]KAF5740659.1 hypothetical protein HS088_TW11G00736 [Tripterygium wilfordii]